ncbi:MAG: glycosyltransferase family 4 protein [Actinomycetota bacterium]
MQQILFVFKQRFRFVELDLELLREHWDVREWEQASRLPNPFSLLRAVWRSDLVYGWFASWQTFLPFTFAWLLRKPSVLITGGFDTANVPEIGYGYQQAGGIARPLSRWIIARASKVVTYSDYLRGELDRNVGVAPDRVTVVHLGVPDPFGALPQEPRKRVALSVANVASLNIERKGLRAFVEASRFLPDVQFTLAGAWVDGSVDRLRELAGPNVTFTGRLSRAELDALFRRASVYVQASKHEGFGLALAEAMLAGCIPVVTRAGALPEVVGDVGVQVETNDPEVLAEGISRALELEDDVRRRARERVLAEYPLEAREAGLRRVVEELL